MTAPLGIIAGNGALPVLIAEARRAAGKPVFIVGLQDAATPDIEKFDHVWLPVGHVQHAAEALQKAGCRELLIIGGLSRPKLNESFDAGGREIMKAALTQGAKGAAGILKLIVGYFERHGFTILPAESAYADLVAPEGLLVGDIGDHEADIALACKIARAIGQLDIGQGAVIRDGLVLCVEAQEGTDAMLARAAELTEGETGGVLAKMPQPQQDRRLDLPAIGRRTVELAAAAKLAVIVFEARGALLIGKDACIAEAGQRGMFLLGVPAATQD